MKIRKATIEDSQRIAELMFLAMEDILYAFMGAKDTAKAKELLLYFITREDNQYSFQNCLVAETGNEITGSITIYDGARLQDLREPVAEYIRTNFNAAFIPEDETEPGEYYIDSLGVCPSHQGKGIGTQMLEFVIHEHVHIKRRTLGLLVDEDNPNAERLYLRAGFEPEGLRSLAGKKMKHLQIKQDKEP